MIETSILTIGAYFSKFKLYNPTVVSILATLIRRGCIDNIINIFIEVKNFAPNMILIMIGAKIKVTIDTHSASNIT